MKLNILGILMYRLFLKASADNIMYGINRNEGVLVLLEHDFLELVDLEARDDAVEHFLGLALSESGWRQFGRRR